MNFESVSRSVASFSQNSGFLSKNFWSINLERGTCSILVHSTDFSSQGIPFFLISYSGVGSEKAGREFRAGFRIRRPCFTGISIPVQKSLLYRFRQVFILFLFLPQNYNFSVSACFRSECVCLFQV